MQDGVFDISMNKKKTLLDEDVTNEYFDTGHILKITLNNK